MILSLVAVCLALGGTLDARLSQLEERVAALAPGQLETPSHGQHKEDVFKEGAAPRKVTKAGKDGSDLSWLNSHYASPIRCSIFASTRTKSLRAAVASN